jgi:hypothetical protein
MRVAFLVAVQYFISLSCSKSQTNMGVFACVFISVLEIVTAILLPLHTLKTLIYQRTLLGPVHRTFNLKHNKRQT